MTRHRGLIVFVVVLGSVGVALLAQSIAQIDHVATLAAFLVAGALSELMAAQVRPGVALSLVNVVAFTALLLGGPELAVPAVFASVLAGLHRYQRPRLMRVAFNAGQLSVAAWFAGLAYEFSAPPQMVDLLAQAQVGGIATWRTLGALSLTAVVFTVFNFGFVAIAVALSSGERITSALRSTMTGLVLQPLYLGLSVMAAVLVVEVHPAALVLLVVPALVARIGLVALEREAEAYDHLVLALVKLIEVKDGYTRGHAERVALLAVELASELGYDFEGRRTARYAALLHDVGKVAVPLHILRKPRALTDAEYVRVKTHPEIGVEVLQDIGFLEGTLPGILHHHERMDGRGYPHGLRGEAIPELARILTVVDAFDAMTSTRAYRRALDVETATGRLRAAVDTQFDARIVRAFERVLTRVDWTPTDVTEIDLTDESIGSDGSDRSEVRR